MRWKEGGRGGASKDGGGEGLEWREEGGLDGGRRGGARKEGRNETQKGGSERGELGWALHANRITKDDEKRK